jgi:Domain of unknown function (DUF4159)
MRHTHVVAIFLLLFGAVSWLPAQAPAKPAKEPLVDQVKKSIDRGVKFLRDQQRRDGSWESEAVSPIMPGGCTALALLALLNAGVKPEDPAIQSGLEYLRAQGLGGSQKVYVVGLMTMVYAEARQNVDLQRVQECVQWLLDARGIHNGQLQGWSYSKGGGMPDNSNSQYALLGLHAGYVAGAKINRADWEQIRDFYIRTKKPDGGWYYREQSGSTTLTMTTAGLCGLLIAGMELNAGRELLLPDGTAKNCGQYEENKHVADALGWVTRHFTYELTSGRIYYNYYGIERAGRLSGLRFFGEHDWYRDGCERLVRLQRDHGAWHAGGTFDNMPIVSTSFALLFLSKGRTPILISKLAHGAVQQRHGPTADWNNDRYDARNLVEFSSRELFKRQPLAWQVFDAGRVQPRGGRWTDEERQEKLLVPLLESPIAYFNGHLAPTFTGTEETLLKEYVEQGGFILAEACCGRKEFDQGFRALTKKLFPDTPLKLLPPEHPIYRAHFVVGKEVELWGIELGCKTVVVYSPKDLSCRWEGNKPDSPEGQLAFRIGGNIVAYATGKEPPKPRLFQTEVISPKGEPDKIPRGFLKVAQVRHDGDWHPAPQAMHNLMLHLRKHAKLDVALQKKEITLNDPDLAHYKLLYMHGRNQFNVAAKDVENLRNNLESGGLLLADACCGRAAFDKAFREFIKKVFPGKELQRIPADDELFNKEINGQPIRTVRVRKEAPGGGAAEFQDAQPFLEGIKFENRWVVIYSKYDIGCALEKHQSTDCLGHDYDSAVVLARAAVLYALKR